MLASKPKQMSDDCSSNRSLLVAKHKREYWYWWLRLCLFFQDVDPYALFKGSDRSLDSSRSERRVSIALEAGHEHLRTDHLNQPNELRLPHTKWDRVRVRLARWLRVFATYFYAKMLLVCFVQYNLLKHQYQVVEKQSEPILGLEAAHRLAELLGNPLYPLKDSSLFLYCGPPGFVFFFIVLLPLYYRRHPMDSSPLRFLLDPQHELKRIDASVRSKLAKVQDSFDIYRRKQQRQHRHILGKILSQPVASSPIDQSHSACRGLLIYQVERMERHEEYFCQQIQRLLWEFDSQPAKLESFRPETFSRSYLVKICHLMQPIFWASMMICCPCNAGIALSFWLVPYLDRCPQLDCNPASIYTFAEVLMSFETLIVTVVLANLLSTLNMIQVPMLSCNQLNLIESSRRELITYRTFIVRATGSARLRTHQSLLSTATNRPKQTKPNKWSLLSRIEVNRFMLSSLIRLLVCDDELARNTSCISMEVWNAFYYSLAVIFIIAASGQFKGSDAYFVRNVILALCWLTVNMIVIACAHIQARILELKRVLWSILATSLELHQECYHEWQCEQLFEKIRRNSNRSTSVRELSKQASDCQHQKDLKCCTFLIDMWTRLIYSSVNNGQRHNPRLFFMEFSYQRLIEANFFAIFVYTFTKRA